MMGQVMLSEIRSKSVIDVTGKVYGKISDVILTRDSLSLVGYVLSGSKVEELLEKFKIRKENDPVVLVTDIEKTAENAIFLTKSIGSLPDKEVFQIKDYIFLSELLNIQIYDFNANSIAEIVDVVVIKGDVLAFLLGGNVFSDLLSRNGCSSSLVYFVRNSDITYNPMVGYQVTRTIKEIEEISRAGL